MLNFLHDMKALHLQNRTVALIQNGSWAPSSAKQMQVLLGEMKNMRVLDPVVTIRSSLKEESRAQLLALKDSLLTFRCYRRKAKQLRKYPPIYLGRAGCFSDQ